VTLKTNFVWKEEDDIKLSIDPNAVIITANNKNCILEDFLIVLFYFCLIVNEI
tara:strand:+ start:1153 stop:1311 length:159 start_codon:yes stop_codon:yes gene_type:complete